MGEFVDALKRGLPPSSASAAAGDSSSNSVLRGLARAMPEPVRLPCRAEGRKLLSLLIACAGNLVIYAPDEGSSLADTAVTLFSISVCVLIAPIIVRVNGSMILIIVPRIVLSSIRRRALFNT